VNFTGSQGEQVLKRVEEMLASGWLLVKEYGADAEGGDKGGYKKLEKIAMTMLDAIAKGEMRLLDTNNQEFTVLTKNPQRGRGRLHRSSAFAAGPHVLRWEVQR